MKIKLAYPKIPDTLDCPLKQCIAFEKLDGTNIHFVYSNLVITEFGTRRDRFSTNSAGVKSFNQAHPELSSLYEDNKDFILQLEIYLLEQHKYHEKDTVLFFEYCGPNSFAGQHLPKDHKKLYLIDAQIGGKLVPPAEFLEDFKEFFTEWPDYQDRLPKVVYKGKFSGQLFVDVRKGKFGVKEGVVVKGMVGDQVYMAKIKTEAYLERLKKEFKNDWKNYWE